MSIEKIIFLVINFLGGVAVISSYVSGLSSKKDAISMFWGGTPDFIKPVYNVSMVLAALSYFAFIYFILAKIDPNSFNFNIFYIIFIGILGASIFWMPLTNVFLTNPGALTWFLIRIVLAIVGISSIALVLVLISLHTKEVGLSYWLAVIGSIYFAFHTVVLDMILWPILFKLK